MWVAQLRVEVKVGLDCRAATLARICTVRLFHMLGARAIGYPAGRLGRYQRFVCLSGTRGIAVQNRVRRRSQIYGVFAFLNGCQNIDIYRQIGNATLGRR